MEYAYDTAKLAHEAGLFNTFVTNGYMTPEAVKTIAPYLDAATVDFKGGGDPDSTNPSWQFRMLNQFMKP